MFARAGLGIVGLALAIQCAAPRAATTQVAPGVHVVVGVTAAGSQPDGNSILFEAPDGLVVIDTGRHAAHTQQILDFAQTKGKPVVAVINSHWHLDHVGGNVLLCDPSRARSRWGVNFRYSPGMTQKRRLSARILSKATLTSGFLKVFRYRLEIERQEGGLQEVNWEVMERGDSVAVLAYDPNRDTVVLANEFRPGLLLRGEYAFADNLVAGRIEPDESPLDAAVREVEEEVGLTLQNPKTIHPGAYVSSGGTSERIVLVFGTVDTGKAGGIHGAEGESESILTVIEPAQSFIDRAAKAELTDLKTVLAAYWLADHRRKAPPKT